MHADRTKTAAAACLAIAIAGPARVAVQEEKPSPKWTDAEVKQRIAEVFTPEERPKVEVFRSRYYIVFTDSAVGPKFAKILDEDVYGGFRKLFPFKGEEDDRLMPVYLFKTKEGYWSFCRRHTGDTEEEARRSAGHSWKDYYATSYESPRDPIHFHEGAHQIMKNRLRLPGGGSWFQEGVAEYYEDKIAKVNRSALTRAAIRGGGVKPLRELFGIESLLQSGGQDKRGMDTGGSRYGQAASLILFLKEGPLGKHFDEFFAKVGRAKRGDVEGIEKILKDVYGLSIEELERRWRDYYAK